ncbi:MAG TPA: hypothetical protein VFU05_07745 [Cyclobacteriaceae bacterium]|nr:hypothetical protein [Cyclobacteriaceae bacterium]
MEKLTSLNLTFDRVLIQLVTPGLLTSFPFILLFFDARPDVASFFLQDSKGLLVISITLIGLVMGIILENLGSRIEVNIYDSLLSLRKKDYFETWEKFLMIQYVGQEPIGHRYLRNILFRMKFELSAGVGLIIMTAGLGIYNIDHVIFKSVGMNILVVYVFPIATSIYLLVFEGLRSAEVLAECRKALVDKYSVD